MMSLDIRLKSVLLAMAMIVAVPTTSIGAEPANNPFDVIINSVKSHPKLLGASLFFWFIVHRRAMTKKNEDYKAEDFKADIKELFTSFNIFDAKLYKQLLFLFDKYGVGLIFKKNEVTKRRKNDDGTVDTEKDFKVKQKPFGIYGHIYSYGLLDLEKFTAYVPMLATMYLLLNHPTQAIKTAVDKAGK